MITIICTNCQASLAIDDAFAGGVCRCQHCGTIQTVPAPQKTSRPASPESHSGKPPKQPGAPKALYKGTAPPASGTGLDDLAEAVASSGLAGSGLASARTARSAPPETTEAEPKRKKALPVILMAAAALVVLVGVAIAILLSHFGNRTSGPAGTANPTASAQSASFCGIPLTGGSVIFLLDRGNATGDLFDTLKATCYKSLAQLGDDRQFQVILWDPVPADTGTIEFPRGSLRNATSGEIENLQRDFQDVSTIGSTSLAGPLAEAIGRHPRQIVIATGKWDLDDADVSALRDAQAKGIRIDAVQLGTTTPSPALQQTAAQTGGQFRAVTAGELREFSR